MPEMRFVARWPDGSVATYYSPSLVVSEYLEPGTAYALADFVERSRIALGIASQRVLEKYGFPCARAELTMAHIERKASAFAGLASATVAVESDAAIASAARE
jgi:uncharacterized repeat protein (TIGR04042 family)